MFENLTKDQRAELLKLIHVLRGKTSNTETFSEDYDTHYTFSCSNLLFNTVSELEIWFNNDQGYIDDVDFDGHHIILFELEERLLALDAPAPLPPSTEADQSVGGEEEGF